MYLHINPCCPPRFVFEDSQGSIVSNKKKKSYGDIIFQQ